MTFDPEFWQHVAFRHQRKIEAELMKGECFNPNGARVTQRPIRLPMVTPCLVVACHREPPFGRALLLLST